MKFATITGTIRRTSLVFGVLLAVAPLLWPAFSAGEGPTARWGTEKSVITQELTASHVQYREFTPRSNPQYENKIMSYILAIDGSLAERMSIVRTRTSPIRDYLMVKNRLYSVMEDHGTITRAQADGIVNKLTASYGTPHPQKSPEMKIYSFEKSGTKVLMMLYRKPVNMDCRVYYYSSGLFRMLITE
ncbi:MAG TPA: hypothetical protein ENN21_09065 [Spirochaetes bacterium]|nr:hypothetical protein [Spirochaetota bacterium]